MSTLTVPEFNVTLAGRDDPFLVRITNGVLVQWDLERAKQNWPTMEAGPALWSAFCCFKAAKKSGDIDSAMSFAAFSDALESVDYASDAEVNPTTPTADPA
jgi:hypothetical protein